MTKPDLKIVRRKLPPPYAQPTNADRENLYIGTIVLVLGAIALSSLAILAAVIFWVLT